MIDVAAYLARIGYEGTLEPTLETLRNLHRAHLLSVPYENLDIHLGRTLPLSLPDIFDKLVTRKRGGWCFEMNGLFAWALRELSFNVTLLGAAVTRVNVEPRPNDHLALLVELDGPYLADVGLGDGLLEPLPLAVGHYRQDFLNYELTRSGETWSFHNHPYGAARGYSFSLEPRRLSDFAGMCHALQTSPESGFVRVMVCDRFDTERHNSLRGAVLRVLTVNGIEERVLENAEDHDRVLREWFGLELPEAPDLWPRVWASHQAWAAAQTQG